MSQIQSILNSLLIRAAKTDPVTVELFQIIADELNRIGIIVDPAPITPTKITGGSTAVPSGVTGFTYAITPDTVILRWTVLNDAFTYYEVRHAHDGIWDTGVHVTTTANREIILDASNTIEGHTFSIGTHRYLIRTLSTTGVYSSDVGAVDVVIPPLGTITINAQQISNNILFRWYAPTSAFRIDHYIITRNGVEVGEADGTFFAWFETVGGTFNYGIKAVDIVGNESAESIITLLVSSPVDFILRSEFISSFTGTLVNAKATGNSLLVCINIADTLNDHFTDYGWNTPQDQIDDGYLRWLSPFETTASYQEEFDCGGIFTNVIVTLAWSTYTIAGSFTIGSSTRVSDDGITWSAPTSATSFLAVSVRYIEVTLNFTGSDDKALLEFFNFQVSVSVKYEIDSGEVACDASDVDGTVGFFNKDFKDVDSITASVLTITGSYTAIVVFDDIPNPTEFAIMVFNNATGLRASKTAYWKARGLVS